MKKYFSRYETLIIVVLFFIVAALLYLPHTKSTGYYDDDWYSMYSAQVAGPQILHQIYAIDTRPHRALVMIPLYILFQGNPFYYSLSAYVFRVLGVLTMLWTLRLAWPTHKKETFLCALLFLVYPGFLSQPTPVDFQSHLIGVWLAYLSIGLSIKSIFVTSRIYRVLLWAGAVLSGWFYLGQMEYYIGFEAVRFLLIFLVFQRKVGWGKLNIGASLKLWIPYSLIPFSFLFWRLFIFEGERRSTDVAAQLGILFSDPIRTLMTWLIFLFQSVANVTILAWSVPVSQLAFGLRLRDSMAAIGLSILVLILFYFVLFLMDSSEERLSESNFAAEGIWVGTVWVLTGLVIVILANRHVVFPEYSRYGLVSAGGAVIFLVALISWFSSKRIQLIILGFLLVSATVTHYANGNRFANSVEDLRTFWWQVSWRIPNLEPETTIVVHYPNGGIREASFVWGPANQIYYPKGLPTDPFQTGISAIPLDPSTVIDILNQKNQYLDAYSLVKTYPDPRHILILSQPSPNSCVQVIDGNAPEYSSYEDSMFLTIGAYSELDHIRLQDSFRIVPEALFGLEPQHNWCYFYEKASLARQRAEWDVIVALGLEASKQRYRPDDLIEWLPFLEAYALTGNEDSLAQLASVIRANKFVARQACNSLINLQGLHDNIRSIINSKYCQP